MPAELTILLLLCEGKRQWREEVGATVLILSAPVSLKNTVRMIGPRIRSEGKKICG